MNAFMGSLAGTQAHRPKLTQQQLTLQMIHNAQNMRIKQEVSKLQEMFLTDQHFQTRLQNGDSDLFQALSSGEYPKIKKVVSDRLKEQMAKQKAEQER